MKPVTLASIKADPEFQADCQRARRSLPRAVAARRKAERAIIEEWIKRKDTTPIPAFIINFDAEETPDPEPKPKAEPKPPANSNLRPARRPDDAHYLGLTATEWAEKLSLKPNTLHQRVSRFGSLQVAVEMGGLNRRGRKPGVGKDFPASKGTGGGTVAQDISELEFSE